MSTKNTKQMLLEEIKFTCNAISDGRAISRYGLGSQINITITHGMHHKLNLICSKCAIIGVRGFRPMGHGKSLEIPKQHWERAWACVPDEHKLQLTEFLTSRQNDIEIRHAYIVYYKGIPVGPRLDQGLSVNKTMSFPKVLYNNRFDNALDAEKAAMMFGKYIKELSEKGNRNFKKK